MPLPDEFVEIFWPYLRCQWFHRTSILFWGFSVVCNISQHTYYWHMNIKITLILIVIIVVGLGGYFLYKSMDSEVSAANPQVQGAAADDKNQVQGQDVKVGTGREA